MGEKWICDDCGEQFKTKKALIEHLEKEFSDAIDVADCVSCQLKELGVEFAEHVAFVVHALSGVAEDIGLNP